ncbi:hypothetical protein PGUG_04443 [Meyerozyma guilliermondii ATCC 6260]|uniref:Ubiquitin carboxyl-terminal hydrolase n=1 Tax=Meyerozyma guilliermondii (strain ATCC 6260 / CBS 566 / DSM 6381 / JCM 1539 / NBRC 10279 / NRRL Y-324) TaxID=294746 RepID=A5DME2_PICGU|nr:uncharacterized protein PGUG_04443 [Meyerozyma guilliermondii ATCC 6260]EDK40345.2 hypothetical protein PGUG_04443 [Meyerozyma guilliermondii ATCC 6260]
MSPRVIPLESNPEIFNQLAHKIGLTPVVQFHDVYSLTDKDLLGLLPQPVFGIILLFPITANYEKYRTETDAGGVEYANVKAESVTWLKQTIGNGCGLYGLLHLLANLPHDLIIENSMLNKLLLTQISPESSVKEVATMVEALESAIQLDANYGNQGQTTAPDANDSVNFHFMSFIKGRDGHLYELDGRRNGPVDLGQANGDNIVEEPKVVEKIQFYMENADEQNKHNFAMMAIGPSTE